MKQRLAKVPVTLLVLLLMVLSIHAQKAVVSGTVTDATTNRPLAGASVVMDGLSVVTNEDGFFSLKSENMGTGLTASHLGYKSQHVSLDGQQMPLTIRLSPAAIELDEVLVTTANPCELVMQAIGRISANYGSRPALYSCFYREKTMKRQHYISVAEGVIDMYKTDYQHGTRRDRVAIRKGRRLLSARQSDTLSVKVMGGPVTPVDLDVVKNSEFLLNAEELEFYDMKMGTAVTIADRPQFVVSIAPRVEMPYALYYGQLYIDQETLAFTRVELSLDMSDTRKAVNAMLVKKPGGLRFRPKELTLLIDYRQDSDGVMRISYLRTTFRFNCDWKRRLFATSFTAVCEMAVTSVNDNDGVQPIHGRDSFDQRDAFYDHVDYFRDPAFWQDYNIIEPSESLDHAVNRLLKKY